MKQKLPTQNKINGFSAVSAVIAIAVILLILIVVGVIFIYPRMSSDKPKQLETPGVNQPQATDDQKISPDIDNDGVPNELEILLGTDPENPDSDGDGISDGEEFNQ